MASVLVFYTLCTLLCGLHGVVTAASHHHKPLHLTYYAHEIRGVPNATVLPAAGTGQGNISEIGWGTFSVVDDYLKAGDTADSRLLGSITGTVVVTTRGGAAGGLQLNVLHIFNDASKYNTSSLTITGMVQTPSPPWECLVPGGTGAFRGYSGYALWNPVAAATVPPLYVFRWDVYITLK